MRIAYAKADARFGSVLPNEFRVSFEISMADQPARAQCEGGAHRAVVRGVWKVRALPHGSSWLGSMENAPPFVGKTVLFSLSASMCDQEGPLSPHL